MTAVVEPPDEPRTLTEVRAHVVALSNSLNKYRERADLIAERCDMMLADLDEVIERVAALEARP